MTGLLFPQLLNIHEHFSKKKSRKSQKPLDKNGKTWYNNIYLGPNRHDEIVIGSTKKDD